MSNIFDNTIDLPGRALQLHNRRTELLASNIANSDTPHYKARDINFREALAAQQSQLQTGLDKTQDGHLSGSGRGSFAALERYRIPQQNSVDGNTSDPNIEKTAFAENAVRYQAAIKFMDGSVKSMLQAIRGE